MEMEFLYQTISAYGIILVAVGICIFFLILKFIDERILTRTGNYFLRYIGYGGGYVGGGNSGWRGPKVEKGRNIFNVGIGVVLFLLDFYTDFTILNAPEGWFLRGAYIFLIAYGLYRLKNPKTK